MWPAGGRTLSEIEALPEVLESLLAHPVLLVSLGGKGLGNADLGYEFEWTDSSPSWSQPLSSGHKVGEEA